MNKEKYMLFCDKNIFVIKYNVRKVVVVLIKFLLKYNELIY